MAGKSKPQRTLSALGTSGSAIDTTTPAGRMFFQVTGAFAEFERAMIRSRVRAGLERARARGVRLGRPKTGAKVEAAIRARLASGEGVKKREEDWRRQRHGATDQG
jgi:DNA invertase Pin-like site-specific DNA recombinase